MNNCANYFELISAYADGELPESDRKNLEEHLDVCENCSAILGLYREMSAGIAESCAAAPDTLHENVMKEISRADVTYGAGGTPGAGDAADGDNMKKRKISRIVLTRLVPAAACLALILLAIPLFLNSGRSDGSSKDESGSLQVYASGAPQMNAPGANQSDGAGTADTAAGTAASGGSGSGSDIADGGSNMQSGAPAPVPAPDTEYGYEDSESLSPVNESAQIPEGEDDITVETGETSNGATAGEPYDTMPVPGEMAGDSLTEPPAGAGSSSDNTLPEGSAETPMAPPAPSPIPPVPSTVPPFIGGGDFPADQAPEDGGSLFNDSIYAIIQINGGLSEFLAMYGLEPVDDMESYYDTPITIPREYADMLIDFIRDLDGVTITILDENGGFAVVTYSPAD